MTYQDARYAVNRVTLLDGRCRDYSASLMEYIGSAVDGEQCWVDTYEGTGPYFYPGILNVQVAVGNHGAPPTWYKNSLTTSAMNVFNDGLIAGAYWSVIGPGKNLQLAVTPHDEIYKYRWQGSNTSGHMEFFDEANYPARLPEPVTLVGPIDAGLVEGAVLTCKESKNALGYQLLLGSNPYRVMDFTVVSDTPAPPTEVITELPFDETWWTIRAYDQYGSTIYTDPKLINASILSLPVENLSFGKKYGYLQDAIDEAYPGDQIIVSPGIYKENINFIGKNLIIRSIDPDDPGIVAATIIQGNTETSVVTLATGEGTECTLSGFTIRGGSTGIYCSGTSPTITHCNITDSKGAGMKLWEGSHPTLAHCYITGHFGPGIEMWTERTGRNVNYNYATLTHCIIAGNQQQGILGGLPTITNCTITENLLHGISSVIPTITNSIIYNNNSDGVQMECESSSITYSDIQGGWLGEGNIDADPLFVDYHLKSQSGRWDPNGQRWIQDETTSPCIDAGDPSSDWTTEPSPNGQRINMGAFGGTPQASKSLSGN
ncbi:MAG: right-handed parallel beta-helix repeat-containing protein [Sedimentisphaerales bacterium]|nr:right-handed parallel beta-helix repeat-containing protein [Sedimentisphaerales bacterium]